MFQLTDFIPLGTYAVFCLVPIYFAMESAGKKKISNLLYGIITISLLLLTCFTIMSVW